MQKLNLTARLALGEINKLGRSLLTGLAKLLCVYPYLFAEDIGMPE